MIIAMLLSFIFITLPLVQRESSSETQAASKTQEQKNEEQTAATVSTTTVIGDTGTTLSQITSTTSATQTTATTIVPTGNITTQEQASQQIENINQTVGGYDSILDDIEGAFG